MINAFTIIIAAIALAQAHHIYKLNKRHAIEVEALKASIEYLAALTDSYKADFTEAVAMRKEMSLEVDKMIEVNFAREEFEMNRLASLDKN